MSNRRSVKFATIGLLAAVAGLTFASSPTIDATSVDLRPEFERFHLTTRRQGHRGTCSAFALTGAIEFAAARQRGEGVPLSVEFLNWASNSSVGTKEDGGFFSDLWKGATTYGVCPEADMPYAAKFDPEIRPGEPALKSARTLKDLGLRLQWIKEWDPKKGLNDSQISAVKATLRDGWPVSGGFLWPKEEHWDEGVLRTAPRDAVRDGHSILIVGYREDASKPGGGVFLIRNSAGPGIDGMMTFAYAKDYMNDAVWVGSKVPHTSSDTQSIPGDLLGNLATSPVGRNRRVSSNEQPRWDDANMDMTWLQPGQVLELPLLEGPGVITHMWFTSHAGRVNELNALSIRIYWDGRKEPGVEAPLGDFFAVGQGRPAPVESIPVQVSPTGSLSCFWKMPFAKSARIVVTNDNPDRGAGLYWQVDWTQLDGLPPDTSYFHAQYRQEYPAAPGHDYLIADLAGAGKYVGSVLSVTLAQDGWFGEGDDFFFIDGESVPSLQGTGSEDYFNDAWGFRARTGPWFGQPRWQGDRAGDSGVAYRWHAPDPVGFTKSLRLTIEHKGNYDDDLQGFYLERPDFLSSVAFWYQTGEPKRFAALPPWNERRVPWRHEHFVRAFREARATGGAKPEIRTEGMFGARPLLAWPNREVGAKLAIPFAVPEAGRYAARLSGMQGPAYGKFQVQFDGRRVTTVDVNAREEDELDLSLGPVELSAGRHEIAFVAEDGRPLAVEMLRLLKLPPPATRPVKTHHEAHFVRLGIGRAIYAYRLAYDHLPESLNDLVAARLMPERFLKDENEKPLKSRREGDFFVVESPGGWTHRWQGLDPRR